MTEKKSKETSVDLLMNFAKTGNPAEVPSEIRTTAKTKKSKKGAGNTGKPYNKYEDLENEWVDNTKLMSSNEEQKILAGFPKMVQKGHDILNETVEEESTEDEDVDINGFQEKKDLQKRFSIKDIKPPKITDEQMEHWVAPDGTLKPYDYDGKLKPVLKELDDLFREVEDDLSDETKIIKNKDKEKDNKMSTKSQGTYNDQELMNILSTEY